MTPRYRINPAKEGIRVYPALVDTVHIEVLMNIYTDEDYLKAVEMRNRLNAEYKGQTLEQRIDLVVEACKIEDTHMSNMKREEKKES